MEDLVSRIQKAMVPYGPFELVFVNDRSPDFKTWSAIEQLAKENHFVRGIDLLYNVGQFRATLCGLEHARGRFIITMDDDLQHPPEEIPKLIDAMNQNASMDCIMGEYSRKQHNVVRNTGSRFFRVIMNRLYSKPEGVVTTSFRIMPASFAKMLTLYRISFPQLGPLIVLVTKKIMNIPVEHHPRLQGQSGYSLSSCVKETFQSVINASILPLRWFSIAGVVTAMIAFLIAFVFFLRWAFGGVGVAGFTSLILTISFFSGMILVGIGLLGEYIGRIIQEITGMPRYQIKKLIDEQS
ncbi:MAG: glycosyltransferase [Candidatus Brocadiaceae bacterium]|nr:glycosyltransferase [Candidatus Brocadiaceae bacterium]